MICASCECSQERSLRSQAQAAVSSERLRSLLTDLSSCHMAASDASESLQGSSLLFSARMRAELLSLLGECITAETGVPGTAILFSGSVHPALFS